MNSATKVSRQLQNETKASQNGTQFPAFPNPFQTFGGQSGASASNPTSAIAGVFLGKSNEAATMDQCSTFLNQVMGQVFSDPTKAMAVITNLMSSSQASTQSLGCLKMALNYADQGVTPAECRKPDGTIDPSCCADDSPGSWFFVLLDELTPHLLA